MIFISFSIEKNIIPCSYGDAFVPPNLLLTISLTAIVSETALYRLLTFHVPKKCPFSCCVVLPLETRPPGDPSGGVVYSWIVLSPEEASRLVNIY